MGPEGEERETEAGEGGVLAVPLGVALAVLISLECSSSHDQLTVLHETAVRGQRGGSLPSASAEWAVLV